MRPLGAPAATAAVLFVALSAQDRLKLVPAYDRAQRFAREAGSAVRGGALGVSWQADGRAFEYTREGKRYRYDVRSRKEAEVPAAGATPASGEQAAQPDRGRQFDRAVWPDGAHVAFYRDRNVWL